LIFQLAAVIYFLFNVDQPSDKRKLLIMVNFCG